MKRHAHSIGIALITVLACTAAAPPPAIDDAAWRLLATGKDNDALEHFLGAIAEEPTAGRPTIGFALTVAALGDLRRGASAMRFALRHDPQALRTVAVDRRLLRRLDTLALAQQTRLETFGPDVDGVLMLGALHYLRGDPEATQWAVDLSRDLNDTSQAAVNLARLLEPPKEPVPPVTEREVERAPDTPPPPPREPVDYETLRASILRLSDTLDRFTQKLLDRLEAAQAQ